MKKDKDKYKYNFQGLALISHMGISVITPILLCLFIGDFIDKKIGTNSLFTIIFIILGSGAGILNIFKISNEQINRK